MHTEIPKRFAGMAPRYTSYPTAPHFHSGIDGTIHARWLSELAQDSSLSLYVHIPYCDRLCWFCGCATKQTNRYDPVRKYLEVLEREITCAASRLDGRARVARLHFGGGSPTMLTPEDLIRLSRHLRRQGHEVGRKRVRRLTGAPPGPLRAPVASNEPEELTRDQLMAEGEKVYKNYCSACHQADGSGMAAANFPPLTGSQVANGPVDAHIDMVLQGKNAMAAFAYLKDREIAAVVTYERNALGNAAGDVVQPAQIAARR